MDKAAAPRRAPQAWLDELELARADVAAGRVTEIDIDALCAEIEAEADAMEAEQRERGQPSAA